MGESMEQSLYELLRQCTVRISLPGRTEHGTGFFVAPGLILTCAHVIKGPKQETGSVEVYWGDQTYSATIKTIQVETDLALLRISLTKHPCVYLQIEVTPFDTLYSYGYTDDHPDGDPATFTLEGRNREGQLKFKFGQVRPGLSGAPVLNARTGYVCGIVQLTRDRNNDLGGRAIPTTTVLRELPEIEPLQRQFHLKDRRWTTLLPSPIGDQNRQRLLKKVRAFWITNVLEESLQSATLIAPDLSKQPEATVDPWHRVLQQPDKTAEPLPAGTLITQVYDSAESDLLILGEPGSGKTTLLLELARELLDRASINENHPIPVVFNLASWTARRQSIVDWLINELNDKYQVPRKLGQSWVNADQILPLLDGLDEVPKEHLAACVNAINTYRLDHGLVPIVICSRSADYLALTTRVQIQHAVAVQPLTPQQIDDYLSSGGEQLEAVRVALRDDSTLHELVETPLMLSVLALAYYGQSIEDLQSEPTFAARHQYVFTTYLKRMLQRRGPEIHYTAQQTTRWLAWLAYQMKQHSQTEFYMERMQPTWYQENWWSRLSYSAIVRSGIGLCSGLLSALIFTFLFWLSGGLAFGTALESALLGGLIFGLFVGLIIPLEREIRPAEVIAWSWGGIWQRLVKIPSLKAALLFGLPFGVVGGFFLGQFYRISSWPIYGLIFGLLGAFIFSQLFMQAHALSSNTLDTQASSVSQQGVRYSVRSKLFLGLIFGLVGGLLYVLLSGLTFALLVFFVQLYALSTGLSFGLLQEWSFALFCTLFPGLLFVLVSGLSTGLISLEKITIKPIEMAIWLWGGLWQRLGRIKGLMYGVVSGLLYGLLSGLLFGIFYGLHSELMSGLVIGLLFGLLFGLLGAIAFWVFNALISGLSNSMMDEHTLVRTNQGMRNSVRNSLLTGLVFGLIGGLVFFGLSFGLFFKLGTTMSLSLLIGLLSGAFGGLVCALTVGLANGGAAYIQHITLRLLLWRARSLPWHYVRFLDYAAERILLRKVGGGYIFIHRLLLEHFTTLNIVSTSAQTVPGIEPTRRGLKIIPSALIRAVLIMSILVSILFVSWFSLTSNSSHIYPSPGMELVFQDPLRSNNSSLWAMGQDPAHDGACTFTSGGYQVSVTKKNSTEWCSAVGPTYSNFALEAQVVIVKGNAGGIIFRANAESGSFYYFWINQAGEYGFTIDRNKRFITTLSSGSSLAIQGGLDQANLLAVVAQGNAFDLYVNHRLIKTVNDPQRTYAQGQLGFTAENTNVTTIVQYTHVRVWISPGAQSTTPVHFYPHSNWNLILNNPMHKNDGSWDSDTSQIDGGSCIFTATGYQVNISEQQSFQYCTNNHTDLSNGAIEVQLTIVKGDNGGIVFRANTDSGDYYYLNISQTGDYSLDIYHNDMFSSTLGSGSSSAIHTGLNNTNLIAVVMQDNIFDLYANHQFISSISDSNRTYTHGQLGLTADEDSNATLVRYANTRVWSSAYPPDHWNLVLNEPMNKNDGSWSDGTNRSTGDSCTFTRSTYEVDSVLKNRDVYCAIQGPDYSSIAVEVQLTIIKGDGGGIVFRVDRSNFYYFQIRQEGNYGLYLHKNNNYIKLGVGSSGAIHMGLNQANVIAVIAQGNVFDLYINHHFIATIIDPDHTYAHGQFGLTAVAYDNSTQVHYTHIKVWTPSF
jgi:DNA polymerase III delta prime subunit